MNDFWQLEAQKILDEAVENGEENGVQFCVYKDNECVIDACSGWVDFARTKKVNTHTIFPIYSSSKGVPAAALTRLIEQNYISTDTLLSEIWPEFAKNGKESTKLIHILEHTSGLPQRLDAQSSYEAVSNWQTMITAIEEIACDWVPGSETRYQSLTYGWVTAEIIQRLTGKSFKEYVQKELFDSEDIQDFYFGTTDEAEKNAAEIKLSKDTLPSSSNSKSVCDPLDDLMRATCIRKAALPGFNGIASAHALAKFYNAVINNRYFSSSTLDKATNCMADTIKKNVFKYFGWGFALSGGIDNIGNIFGHGGYGGTDGLADRKQRLTLGFTTSTLGLHPCKEKLFKLINLRQRENWES